MAILKIHTADNGYETFRVNGEKSNIPKKVADSKEVAKYLKVLNKLGVDLEITVNRYNTVDKIYNLPIVPNYLKDNGVITERKYWQKFKISNYGLAIDKFGRFNGKTLDYAGFNGKLYYNFETKNYLDIIKYTQVKQTKIINKLRDTFNLKQLGEIKQNWRLVLNLGGASAYNNGFLLHPVYGIPYLNGSAIKGMCRNYVVETYFDSKEVLAEQDPDYIHLFGANIEKAKEKQTNKQGLIHFVDTFPTNTDYSIALDIISNHNTTYYNDDNKTDYPTDTEGPTIIKFITLKNAVFNPYFYCKKKNKSLKISSSSKISSVTGKSILEAMQLLMTEAFKKKGIGAKTNLAYGRIK